MLLEFTLATFFCIVVLAMVFFFYEGNKKLKSDHSRKVSILRKSIFISEDQLEFRSENLNKYHFLKYNLNEALLHQKEIVFNNI